MRRSLVRGVLLSSRPSQPPPAEEEAFFDWVAMLTDRKQVLIHDDVAVQRIPGVGLDLYAKANIPAGATLIRVDESVWKPFSAEHAVREIRTAHSNIFSAVQQTAQQLMPNQSQGASTLVSSVCLALHLLYMKQSKHPYASFLWHLAHNKTACSMPHPLLLDPDRHIRRFLAGTSIQNDLLKRQQLYHYVAQCVMSHAPNLSPQELGSSSSSQSTSNLLLWSIGTILSRGLSGSQFPFSLVPALDLANHSDRSPNALHSFHQQGFHLQASRPIASDESICIHYGTQRSTSSFLTLYGFPGGQCLDAKDSLTKTGRVISYNPADRLEVWLPAQRTEYITQITSILQKEFAALLQSQQVHVQAIKRKDSSIGLLVSISYAALLGDTSSGAPSLDSVAAFLSLISHLLLSEEEERIARRLAIKEPSGAKSEALKRIVDALVEETCATETQRAFGEGSQAAPKAPLSPLEFLNMLSAIEQSPLTPSATEKEASEGTAWLSSWRQMCAKVQANRLRCLLMLQRALEKRPLH